MSFSGNLLMRLQALTIVVAGLVAAAPASREEAARQDRDKLQGVWALVLAEQDGEKAPEQTVKLIKLVFKGEQYTLGGGEKSVQGTYRLDTAGKPRAIDLMPGDGPAKGKTLPGIYELAGDTLRLCYVPPTRERPT